ncbi:hypothetical protein H3H36_19165 [Duganella sp. FT3S]|uniref:Ribosomal protein S3AE n=1 Tax=Rugamonas fusca TaxID=2758568 RepID=A0A7W2EKB0_9BURK|nr:hypothetical protein [Rugamonas fusca]MBA5607481.1 hypothetical protein [Rugamonas fusca]
MLQALPYPIRQECPPGACVCGRDGLLDALDTAPETDVRILRLTREEEKRLVARIEAVASYEELQHMTARMDQLLGMVVSITPSVHGVRTVRGLTIELAERPGLCRKTRQTIPAAIRRCLDRHPEIVYALLNARDLLGAA